MNVINTFVMPMTWVAVTLAIVTGEELAATMTAVISKKRAVSELDPQNTAHHDDITSLDNGMIPHQGNPVKGESNCL